MNHPVFIVGPCAAESEEQVLATAHEIVRVLPNRRVIFRAGVWKPRTSPDTFQGIGEPALAWLLRVRQETGLPIATEVATSEHIRAALAVGIDYVWLGARTTANPILVQQLADTLASTPHPTLQAVLVKNPVNNDPQLWLGDIVRLEQTGVPVMAIHRGCNHRPCWSMAHWLHTLRPDIPLLLDPSHLGGVADRVAPLMQQAESLCFDGAMIETHIFPHKALSDAKQQLTPAQLAEVLRAYPLSHATDEQLELRWLRAEIDELDDELWATIANRMEISSRIGQWKQANGMPALQQSRFDEILSRRLVWAHEQGLSAEMVENIFREIHRESLARQCPLSD